jgi:hypothetical protein
VDPGASDQLCARLNTFTCLHITPHFSEIFYAFGLMAHQQKEDSRYAAVEILNASRGLPPDFLPVQRDVSNSFPLAVDWVKTLDPTLK